MSRTAAESARKY